VLENIIRPERALCPHVYGLDEVLGELPAEMWYLKKNIKE